MKIKLLAVLFAIVAVGRLQAGTETTGAQGANVYPVGPGGWVIVSPDHPRTFEVGFNDKVSQRLRWSEESGELVLDVTYSRITYTDTIPPSDFKTYTVAFPGVKLDMHDKLYVLNNHKQKIIIGGKTGGPFGTELALNKGVHLSAHRHAGRLNAALLVGNAR